MRKHLAFLALCAALTCAQEPAPAWQEFSIGPPTRNASRMNARGITAEGIPLLRVIARAYGVPEYLVDGPGWLDSERYALTATVADPKDFQPLLQRELAQRFHLQARRQKKQLSVELLQPIDGVPHKLTRSGNAQGGSIESGSVKLANETVAQFAKDLAEALERPVIDQTGIAGRFDYTLSWNRRNIDSLRAAVKDQLGLQMIEAKQEVEVLVVDHVEKLSFSAAPATANAAPASNTPDVDIAGDWSAILNAGAQQFRLVLHFAKNQYGGLIGGVDNLDQPNGKGKRYNSVSFQDSTLRLTQTTSGITGSYEGKLTSPGVIEGNWTQPGLTVPVVLTRIAVAPPSPVKISEFAGAWQGDLDMGLASLWLIFHIQDEPGGPTAFMVSPDQEDDPSNPEHVAATSVQIDGAFLTIAWEQLRAVYRGRMNNDHTAIDGQFLQAGTDTSLTLKPVKNEAELVRRRPQTPVKPYPYREERVHYSNPSAHIKIGATLTLPPGRGPFPAVVLIAGSGPLDRDENVNGHKIFLVLSDYLTRHGIAVLRADKRGVGESQGSFKDALSTDFASDVEAGIRYLKDRKEIDNHKIGLVGHSEGGLIAPIVAARNPDVAFIVLMAGTGVPGDEFAAEQIQTGLDALGAASPVAAALLQQTVAANPSSPWMSAFLALDPATALRKVKCPVLAINGSKDKQVLPGPNLRGIRAALEAGGNQHFEVEELPGLNHLFQTAATGWPREYGHIEESIAPPVLEKISNWILKTAG